MNFGGGNWSGETWGAVQSTNLFKRSFARTHRVFALEQKQFQRTNVFLPTRWVTTQFKRMHRVFGVSKLRMWRKHRVFTVEQKQFSRSHSVTAKYDGATVDKDTSKGS